MRTYSPNEHVGSGFYIGGLFSEWVNIPKEGGRLPEGGADARYIRIPKLLAAVAGPFLGLGLVMFVPFVVFYSVFKGILSLAAALLSPLGKRIADLSVNHWVPGVSYFIRRKRGFSKPAKK
ncbi:MAG: hypothetical protein FJ088_13210 [Deltaproteobacteria bacterium]|nr:hypothetical protein [Deltaproteobacteria bacterium]